MTAHALHILYVDDNPGDLDLAREALQQNGPGIFFHTAGDGEQALDFLYRRTGHIAAPRPHLILLDLNMPRKSGLETLKVIKQDAALKTIPVVIFTSSTAADDLNQAYHAHANAYVIKPSDLDNFLHVVQEVFAFWCKVATFIH